MKSRGWTCVYGGELAIAAAEAVRRHREIQISLCLYVYLGE